MKARRSNILYLLHDPKVAGTVLFASGAATAVTRIAGGMIRMRSAFGVISEN